MIKQFILFALEAVIITLSCIAGATSPMLLAAGTVVSGVIFMVSAYKNSLYKTLVLVFVALISSAAVSFTAGFNTIALCKAAELFLLICVTGTVIGLVAKGGLSLPSAIIGGGLCCLAPLLIWFVYFKFVNGINIAEEFINKPVALFIEAYKQTIASSGFEVSQKLLQVMDEIQWYLKQFVAMVMPSVFIILCSLASYVIFSAGRTFLSKFHGIHLNQYPVFHALQMPRSASIVLAVLFTLSLFMGSTPFADAVINIIIILCAVFTFCGFSVVDCAFSKKRIPLPLRIILYPVIFMVSSVIGLIIPLFNVPSLLLLIGVTDSMFDFRKLAKRE